MGAVRIGNFARYLIDRGHDVKIIAGKDQPYQRTLAIELPREQIIYARWVDVNAGPRMVAAAIRRIFRHTLISESCSGSRSGDGGGAELGKSTAARASRVTAAFSSLYMQIVYWPDSRIGWFPFAVRAGHKLLARWIPEVIFASGPPFTTLLVGRALSRAHRVPLIVEMRDRWSDDPYYPPPRWRRTVDAWAEHRILGHARAVITVSEPWAEAYREKYGKPVCVMYNGYDAQLIDESVASAPRGDDGLQIVYTGGIYPGRRDPSALFAALAMLGKAAEQVRIEFYRTDEAHVMPLAAAHGVQRLVHVHAGVSHDEAVRVQRSADVLFLMQWNDPREQGNVPGKFFEYLGALRPILVLGLEDGVPATILRERNAGVFSNDPRVIARHLSLWMTVKREKGAIPDLPKSVRAGLSRDAQYSRLEGFLARIV